MILFKLHESSCFNPRSTARQLHVTARRRVCKLRQRSMAIGDKEGQAHNVGHVRDVLMVLVRDLHHVVVLSVRRWLERRRTNDERDMMAMLS